MFNHILVPTDFSPQSTAALAYARELAATTGASIHLLHVAENVFLRAVAGDPGERKTALLRQLEESFTDDDRRRLAVRVAVERSDEPADEIVSCARMSDIDLIVMGTHGRGGLARAVMGSVAEHVVRTAPCPVLTVHQAPATDRPGPSRILVATDFSPPSDTALEFARTLAARFGASLHLLHVVEDPTIGGPVASEMYLAESPATRTERLKDSQARLSHRVTGSDRAALNATTEVVFGRSAEMIVDYAADTKADLIVMGTHGRTGLAHLLVGSVAERVVRHAACPVLTVREPRAPALAPAKAQEHHAAAR